MGTPFARQPMLARRQLRLAVVAALQAIPGLNVQSPGDWNTPPAQLPAALVRTSNDRKDAQGTQQPEFTTAVSVDILLRVQAITQAAAQDALEALGYQVEKALFTNYAIVGMLSRISSVDTDTEITAEGSAQFGRASIRMVGECFESFDSTEADPAPSAWPVVPAPTVPLESVGVHADLVNVYDPSGTYTPSADAPPYTPTAAPRTSGPDGRDEGALDIALPQ
jgi:hypothetical protein